MSEHDIADCPKCGKRDYVLKENNYWTCLNCGHGQKMPKSSFEPDSNPNIFSMIVTALIALMFVMVALGI